MESMSRGYQCISIVVRTAEASTDSARERTEDLTFARDRERKVTRGTQKSLIVVSPNHHNFCFHKRRKNDQRNR
jgi:hypothetical protein